MPQGKINGKKINVSSNPVQAERDTYILQEWTDQMQSGKKPRPKVLPGTQNTGSTGGLAARREMQKAKNPITATDMRETGLDADRSYMNTYLKEQTARMRAATAKKTAGRKTMGALLGIAGAAKSFSKRGK